MAFAMAAGNDAAENTPQESAPGIYLGPRSPPPVGVDRRTLRCWEYGSVSLRRGGEHDEECNDPCDGQSGRISIVDAWFGDPEQISQRRDLTREVRDLHAAQLQSEDQDSAATVHATTRLWGDPARFRMKQLEVTYEYEWLTTPERRALELLQWRVNEKAQTAPDLETLLERLGAALVGATRPGNTAALGAADDSDGSCPSPDKKARPTPLGTISPRWRQLGFQSSDPRSDLRTGRLALEALVYLAEHYPQATGQMVREAQSDGLDYPFAVASINVTQHLARYLGLVGDGTTCSVASASAPHRVVRRFARLLMSADIVNVDPFGELHAAVMGLLHATWREHKICDPQLTVMDFAPVLENTLAVVHRFCVSTPLESANEFRDLQDPGSPGDLLEPAGQPELPPLVRKDKSAAYEPTYGLFHSSLQRTVSTVSQTAGIMGTYLQGIVGDTAAAYVSSMPPAAGDDSAR